MEGKAILFKQFGGVDAVPIALATTDTDEIIETVVRLAPSFGGVNLEDISAPRCFEIERRLQEALDIPVFHDDQHGTAVVTLAALRNAAKLTGRTLGELRGVISGAGAAGVAIAKFLLEAGLGDVAVADRKGIVSRDRQDLTDVKRELAEITNKAGLSGSLETALAGADVFIGVSGGTVPEPAVASMAPGAFVFAMANRTRRSTRTSRTSTRRWSPRAVRTTRTRSTTCWRSRASSRAPSRSGPPGSPRA